MQGIARWFEHSSSTGPRGPRSLEAVCLPNTAQRPVLHQGMPTDSNKAAIAPACKNIRTPPTHTHTHSQNLKKLLQA